MPRDELIVPSPCARRSDAFTVRPASARNMLAARATLAPATLAAPQMLFAAPSKPAKKAKKVVKKVGRRGVNTGLCLFLCVHVCSCGEET